MPRSKPNGATVPAPFGSPTPPPDTTPGHDPGQDDAHQLNPNSGTQPTIYSPSPSPDTPTPPPGELDQPPKPPELPQELASQLTPREHRTVCALVQGQTYQDALTTAGVPPRARIRNQQPPQHVTQAAEYLIKEVAYNSGISRKWVITNLVSLYRRAVQAEPVLDRRGQPTGEWRFDGATARGCLELLGKQAGMFGASSRGMAASDVAELLRIVGDQGRPPLPGDRARVINGDAQPQARRSGLSGTSTASEA